MNEIVETKTIEWFGATRPKNGVPTISPRPVKTKKSEKWQRWQRLFKNNIVVCQKRKEEKKMPFKNFEISSLTSTCAKKENKL